ncbi:hypothetical protein AB0F46_35355 [Streptomyces sp. NPDC026665]|uniref:hypothetical protein n=1 Tax=Streptomyces sp. NPDC026665 TaxID=3154798 RepID=UPI0033D385F2
MNIIDIALAEFAEMKAMEADAASDYAEEAEREFLKAARSCADRTLAPAAADLDWQYVPADALPEQVEEARAVLVPGRPEYLRYRVEHSDDTGVISLDLVEPGQADRISPVTSLSRLGQLLTPAPNTAHGPGEEQAEQQGPLAGVEEVLQRAARVAALARQLLAEHPDAGLVADTVSVFGHQSGNSSAELHLSAEGMEALRQIAAAIEAEVNVWASNGHGTVLEHGTATSTVDGIAVHVRAYEPMPAGRAAVWLAQQDQPAAEASDGGEN